MKFDNEEARAAFVALRKESVDRNNIAKILSVETVTSLSARRAWIEIKLVRHKLRKFYVALRKESVDRNGGRCG